MFILVIPARRSYQDAGGVLENLGFRSFDVEKCRIHPLEFNSQRVIQALRIVRLHSVELAERF